MEREWHPTAAQGAVQGWGGREAWLGELGELGELGAAHKHKDGPLDELHLLVAHAELVLPPGEGVGSGLGLELGLELGLGLDLGLGSSHREKMREARRMRASLSKRSSRIILRILSVPG